MEDFLLFDEIFTEEEKLTRDTIRRFIDNEVVPILPQAFEEAKFPKELIPKIAELGILGMTLPAQYGGSEANSILYGLACQELERGDSAIRSFVSVQNSLCMYPIHRYGNEEQRQKYLPAMAKGEIIACFGLTEPDAGSDPASMKTFAKKVQGGWRMNGTKMWITNAPFADISLVWAKTDSGIRGFLVEKETEGLQRLEIHRKMSLRISATGELVLQDCFVPDANLLPGTEKGLGAALSCLTQARYGIAWGAIGAAMSCYETVLNYTKERIQFQKPIASFQLIQKDLADMLTEICKAQCLNLRLAQLRDQKKATPTMISMGKMNACRVALKIARMARNLMGASGISLEYPVIRHMVNLESVFTYEGTDNIHHLIIGKHITELSAFE